jgi:hypothetical protein
LWWRQLLWLLLLAQQEQWEQQLQQGQPVLMVWQ